jgi:hypothetical protein
VFSLLFLSPPFSLATGHQSLPLLLCFLNHFSVFSIGITGPHHVTCHNKCMTAAAASITPRLIVTEVGGDDVVGENSAWIWDFHGFTPTFG